MAGMSAFSAKDLSKRTRWDIKECERLIGYLLSLKMVIIDVGDYLEYMSKEIAQEDDLK